MAKPSKPSQPENKQESKQKKKLHPKMDAVKWKPGQSGNPGGRPKKRLLDQILTELLEASDSSEAVAVAKALLKKAKKGDSKAAQLIAERTEGKPTQKVVMTGLDGGAIQTEMTVRFVKADGIAGSS